MSKTYKKVVEFKPRKVVKSRNSNLEFFDFDDVSKEKVRGRREARRNKRINPDSSGE